jgi:hypothetical protein
MNRWDDQDVLAVCQFDERLIACVAAVQDIAARVGRVPERADLVEDVGIGLEGLAVDRIE